MFDFRHKDKIIIAGIMTGTSLDAVDCAIVEFSRFKKQFKVLAYSEYEYSPKLKEFIKYIIDQKCLISDVSQANYALAELYWSALQHTAHLTGYPIEEIEAIGVHGQTVYHQPISSQYGEYNTASTLQLISPAVLSIKSGLPVISDFRAADIALGGQGAPLVPIFDFDFFSDKHKNRILLNIGGMANLTFLKAGGSSDTVTAFDTGPGNVLIDLAVERLFGMAYDKNGEIASKGQIIDKMMNELNSNMFINLKPPKSTGRETFNANLIENYFQENYNPYDIVRTLTEFTASSIAVNIINNFNNVEELIISGGGALNTFLIERIKYLTKIESVVKLDKFGLTAENKEAVCFAYLAFKNLNNYPANLPSVTGASKAVVLGSYTFIK